MTFTCDDCRVVVVVSVISFSAEYPEEDAGIFCPFCGSDAVEVEDDIN